MLRRFFIAGAALALSVGSAQAQEKVSLKIAHFLPVQSMTHTNLFVPMAERIKEQSKGRIDAQVFPGGSLGRNPAQQLQLVMDGVVDIAFIVQSYTPGEFPDNSLLELPLVLSSTKEASVIHQRLYERGLLRGYDKVKVIGLATTSAYTTHVTFPYKSIGDLKGRKIRVATSIQSEIVEALGGVPVGGIAVTQTAEALSRSLIEGTLLGWESMNTFRVTPVTTFHINVPLGFTPLMVAMNKQKYDALPADLKAVIDGVSGTWVAETMAANYDTMGGKALADAKASGKNTVVEMAADDRARWEKALMPVVEKWKASHPNGDKLFAALQEEQKKMGGK